MRRLLSVSTLVFCLALSPAYATDRFASGSNAYSTGFYGSAARHWLNLAEKGHAPAQYNIGRMHYYGQGVARDRIEAYKWFLIAEQGGIERSRVAAQMLEERLTGREVAEATLRAREWHRRNTRSH